MTETLIVVSSYDPGYLRISEHLLRRALAAGQHPIVLDVSKALASPPDTYHRGTLKLFGRTFPGHDLTKRFTSLGAEVIDISSLAIDPSAVALPREVEELLDSAIESALITFYRTEVPNMRRRSVVGTRRRLDREGRTVWAAVHRMLDNHQSIGEVVVPNGRFPNQKLATLAAHSRLIPTMHFEKGETPDGAYLQPYAPQSRILSQNHVGPTLKNLAHDEIVGVAEGWMSRRWPSKDSPNEFAALWDEDLPPGFIQIVADGARIAGFFTSSQDEFQSLGPEWQLHSWNTQFEAFDAVMTILEKQGFRCFLRVHPNLATKAQDSYVNEREGIKWIAARHPDLLVIWHDQAANSYRLLEQCAVAVVWDSTIGLEASARRIPVWTMATSRYGLTADVRELLTPAAVTEKALVPWTVDPYGAQRFIAYLVLRDSQMPVEFDAWETWDTGSSPFGVSIARVLVSGGNPTPRTAVTSLVDVYRHRGVRANLRSLLRR